MDKISKIAIAANTRESNPMEQEGSIKKIADLLANCDDESLEQALNAISKKRNGNGKKRL